jgi:hypothetical protein
MARTVYSLRIYGHASLSSAGGLVGPLVPAGLVYVVRDIDVVEVSGTRPANLQVMNQVGGLLVFMNVTSANPAGNESWRGRQVYGAGERVGLQVLSGSFAIAVSGYQLTLP